MTGWKVVSLFFYPHWLLHSSGVHVDSIHDSAPASNSTGTGDYPTENSNKDNNATGIDSASNSDNAEEPNIANNLNETVHRPEAMEVQVVLQCVKFS